jgi:hypothetical protein
MRKTLVALTITALIALAAIGATFSDGDSVGFAKVVATFSDGD